MSRNDKHQRHIRKSEPERLWYIRLDSFLKSTWLSLASSMLPQRAWFRIGQPRAKTFISRLLVRTCRGRKKIQSIQNHSGKASQSIQKTREPTCLSSGCSPVNGTQGIPFTGCRMKENGLLSTRTVFLRSLPRAERSFTCSRYFLQKKRRLSFPALGFKIESE